MSTTLSAEKRGSTRISYHCEVECYGLGVGPLNPRITDLSATGAFIDSLMVAPVGSLLRLTLPVGADSITITAEVCHSMPQIGMGVRFLDLTAQARAVLAFLIEERLRVG